MAVKAKRRAANVLIWVMHGTAAIAGRFAGMSEAADLLEQAKRCRRLADGINDPKTVETLRKMADDYEKRAAEAESRSAP